MKRRETTAVLVAKNAHEDMTVVLERAEEALAAFRSAHQAILDEHGRLSRAVVYAQGAERELAKIVTDLEFDARKEHWRTRGAGITPGAQASTDES